MDLRIFDSIQYIEQATKDPDILDPALYIESCLIVEPNRDVLPYRITIHLPQAMFGEWIDTIIEVQDHSLAICSCMRPECDAPRYIFPENLRSEYVAGQAYALIAGDIVDIGPTHADPVSARVRLYLAGRGALGFFDDPYYHLFDISDAQRHAYEYPLYELIGGLDALASHEIGLQYVNGVDATPLFAITHVDSKTCSVHIALDKDMDILMKSSSGEGILPIEYDPLA